jgi:hypothetical protein
MVHENDESEQGVRAERFKVVRMWIIEELMSNFHREGETFPKTTVQIIQVY